MSEQVTLKASPENLEVVLAMVREAARKSGFPESRTSEVEVAAEEAFINIARYAYETEGDCTVSCSAEDGLLTVTMVDQGKEFDPVAASAPDTTAGIDARPAGGLGILMLRKLMDGVTYRREEGKNILVMTAGARKDAS